MNVSLQGKRRFCYRVNGRIMVCVVTLSWEMNAILIGLAVRVVDLVVIIDVSFVFHNILVVFGATFAVLVIGMAFFVVVVGFVIKPFLSILERGWHFLSRWLRWRWPVVRTFVVWVFGVGVSVVRMPALALVIVVNCTIFNIAIYGSTF